MNGPASGSCHRATTARTGWSEWGVTYQFNPDGQMTQRGTDTFQYSAKGELLQATVSGQTITYSYDGMGDESRKRQHGNVAVSLRQSR